MTAANNACFATDKYLIEVAKCAINSQNRRTESNDCFLDSISRSTVLHVAASIGDKDLVAYLVEHGADIYIKNQAGETPFMLDMIHSPINHYFQDYLLCGYSNRENFSDLPLMPVAKENRPQHDCIWEYRAIDFNANNDPPWHPFPPQESSELLRHLYCTSRMNISFYLTSPLGLYYIDLEKLLCIRVSVVDTNYPNTAWIRCRGSSILNCNCYCVWQILLLKHDEIDSREQMMPSLEFEQLPRIFQKERNLRLNSWYYCDAKTNSVLDTSMNDRRESISISVPFTGKDLIFDLFDFTFYNTSFSICGYIRWLQEPSVITDGMLTEISLDKILDDTTATEVSCAVDGEEDYIEPNDFSGEKTNERNNASTMSMQDFDTPDNFPVSPIVDLDCNNDTNSSLFGYEQRQQDLQNISNTIQNLLREATTSLSTRDWIYYKACFLKLFKQKLYEYQKILDNMIITVMSKLSTKLSLGGKTLQMAFTQEIDNCLKSKPIDIDINRLKRSSLDLYIKRSAEVQTFTQETKPSKLSNEILDHFIAKLKYDFEVSIIHNSSASGKEFETVPNVLKRIQLFYRTYALQLPLYESGKELLAQIEDNTVCAVSTSIGSVLILGKSTLLPVLLIANDYPRVIIVQPRRLACVMLCDRVNKTMVMANGNEPKLAGWIVSGAQQNINAPILYITDGIMKERLLYDDNLFDFDKNQKPTVFIIEIQERNVNIDICIALFTRLLTEKPQLRQKIKLVLSSATLAQNISDLFTRVPELNFGQFTRLTTPTPYNIAKILRPNENLLDVVQELYKTKKHREDQILCFVSSVSEVHRSCQLLAELSNGSIVAYPLTQSQSVADQQKFIEQGSVFFSATLAETSLTFPSLVYVIDVGMINVPTYDLEKKRMIIKETHAAESTIEQRKGRLGRTKPGEYYALYNHKVEDKKCPTPQICQTDLTELEFSLRKSSVKNGLNYLKRYLPDPPTEQAIQLAIQELKKTDILTADEKFTPVGTALSKLPSFSSLALAKSVFTALTKYNCGGDLIILSSILHALNTATILKIIPVEMKSSDGDFMTLINLMKQLLSVKQFSVEKFCQSKRLSEMVHLLERALKRYSYLEKSFNLSDEYREKAQLKSGEWSLIAKSLLEGYSENVFVSLKELQGKTHHYLRYNSIDKEIGVLDLKSTLIRSISMPPVSVILARDIYYPSSVRERAVLSFVGELNTEWITQMIERKLTLVLREEEKLQEEKIIRKVTQMFPTAHCHLTTDHQLVIRGPSGPVIEAELYIRQQLIVEFSFQLRNDSVPNSVEYENVNRNIVHMSKLSHIFNPMIWRWEIQEQVKISVEFKKLKKQQSPQSLENVCEVTVQGRVSQNQRVRSEFKVFFGWLKTCSVMRHPNSGVPPRTMKPQIRSLYSDVEERIARITDSKRTSVDLWSQLIGSKATRETRMEAVAWIAVCKFHCHLEGGFIRDWVVGSYTAKPKSEPSIWLKRETPIPYLDKELIPSDLDCHLPTHYYFDIDNFLDYLHKYHIECAVVRQDWRYIIIIDEHASTGPFTMDLIEPHVALTHDRIDFDVNNLYLEKDYKSELGMRVDITQKPYNIDLEATIYNIKNKTFQVLRHIDSIVSTRVDKMKSRGWKQIGTEMNVIPNPAIRYNVVLVQLPPSSVLYGELNGQMISKIPNCQILSIEEIKNPLLEDVYLAMKMVIARTCKGHNPNECQLFHGTYGEAIDGILNDGFDDHNFSRQGLYGEREVLGLKLSHGAYFADNPAKSHKYTEPDPVNKTRVIIYSKVILGTQYRLDQVNHELRTAPIGYDSVLGKHDLDFTEYIVYRYGQALPYLKIIYKTT
ncbi:unnamed protein product [Didymodactylos carnosus]|uniref:Poly [ADP-ribose] polymerase n=1 Tax=Didymodactylos carnosus TaxID=1234261 RepID=A0A814ZUR2_9BILA|nr:unnamed protein product [Didymodactylos carnosus]CAF1246571.1 unnamed protein product [Didymodactylos carnosus]CAF3821300.1 unnamed protein product [Didymodactylos carnosus]CAF4012964.1 unnamed protein product [Didymodactylos carnosus]